SLTHTIRPSTYLNRLSLDAWRLLFQKVMPGVTFIHVRDHEHVVRALRALRDQGELAGYTDEELLTVDLIAIWQKPRTSDVRLTEESTAEQSHSQLGDSGAQRSARLADAARVNDSRRSSSQLLRANGAPLLYSPPNSTP